MLMVKPQAEGSALVGGIRRLDQLQQRLTMQIPSH